MLKQEQGQEHKYGQGVIDVRIDRNNKPRAAKPPKRIDIHVP